MCGRILHTILEDVYETSNEQVCLDLVSADRGFGVRFKYTFVHLLEVLVVGEEGDVCIDGEVSIACAMILRATCAVAHVEGA